MAKAFGAPVTRLEVKEIGWGEVRVTDHALAARWLDDGTVQSIEMFQWHGDTFALRRKQRTFCQRILCAPSLRDGARQVCAPRHAVSLRDDAALIRAWTDDRTWQKRSTSNAGATVERACRRRADARACRRALYCHEPAGSALYARWSEGLVR